VSQSPLEGLFRLFTVTSILFRGVHPVFGKQLFVGSCPAKLSCNVALLLCKYNFVCALLAGSHARKRKRRAL
jgi:hypothetical protein